MSTLEVNTINPQSGNDVTIGGSSKNVKFASGTTVDFSTNTPTLTLGADMKATPAFAAKMSGSQNISHNTSTKITVNTEIFDTDNAYDNSSNYRFTPQTAGKYYCTFNINSNANGQANFRIANAQIYFNGSLAYISGYDKATGYENNGRESLSAIITFNGSSDYIEPYFYGYTQNSGNIEIGGSNTYDCQFSAYRIIGL